MIKFKLLLAASLMLSGAFVSRAQTVDTESIKLTLENAEVPVVMHVTDTKGGYQLEVQRVDDATAVVSGIEILPTNESGSDNLSIVIPASVRYGNKTFRVAGIGNNAFSGVPEIAAVLLPKTDSFTIGDYALSNCQGLKSFGIPAGVTLGVEPFKGCPNLREIIIGEGTKTISCKSLLGMPSLTTLTLPASLESISDIALLPKLEQFNVYGVGNLKSCGGLLCNGFTLLSVPCGFSGTLTIPGEITQISPTAFAGCVNVTKVIFPEKINELNMDVFRDMENLQEVTLRSESFGDNSMFTEEKYRNGEVGKSRICFIMPANGGEKSDVLFNVASDKIKKNFANKSGFYTPALPGKTPDANSCKEVNKDRLPSNVKVMEARKESKGNSKGNKNQDNEPEVVG